MCRWGQGEDNGNVIVLSYQLGHLPPPPVFLFSYCFPLPSFPSLFESFLTAQCGCTDGIHLSCNGIVNPGPMGRHHEEGLQQGDFVVECKVAFKTDKHHRYIRTLTSTYPDFHPCNIYPSMSSTKASKHTPPTTPPSGHSTLSPVQCLVFLNYLFIFIYLFS